MLVLNHSEYRRKTFQYIALIFIIVFFGFIFSGNFIYSVTGQYFENYLSIYANAHDLLLQKEIPMWSFNFFLGGNFLGAQNVYSLYNPFFLLIIFLAYFYAADFSTDCFWKLFNEFNEARNFIKCQMFRCKGL